MVKAALIIFLLGNVHYLWRSIAVGANLIDFHGQWAICSYTLRGADPYQAIGVEPPLFDDIGAIPLGWGTSPWGCVLGNLFYPGWLPFDVADKYFFAINIIVLLLTVAIFLDRMLSTVPRGVLISFAFVMLTAENFWSSVFQGNCGGMICCLLIIACLIYDDHSILAGVALGIAMIKPQTALIICFAFLLAKKIRPLIVAAAVDVVAWISTTLLLERTPIEVMQEFFFAPIGLGARRGILTLWADWLPGADWVMPLSMLIGVIFVVILQRRFDGILSVGAMKLAIFLPAFAAANFWSYSWANERFTLTLLMFLSVWLAVRATERLERWALMLAAAVCNFYPTLVEALHDLIELFVPTLDPSTDFTSWHQSITILELSFALMTIFLTVRLVRSARA